MAYWKIWKGTKLPRPQPQLFVERTADDLVSVELMPEKVRT